MKSCVTTSLLLASMISLGRSQNTYTNIQSLNLQSPPGQQTLRCGGHYTFTAAASVSIQTPRYPRKYPNGRRGRCSWFFSLPAMTEVSMVCDSFRVRRGDRLCIDDNHAGARQCYYGSNDRTFYFPLNLSSSTNIGNRYSVEMKFRPNKKKSSKGFRCVLSTMTSSTTPPPPSTATTATTQAPQPPPTCIAAGDTCSAATASKDTCCGENSACFETFSGSGTTVCTACIKEGEKCETATATNCCKDARFCSTDGAGGFGCSKCLKDDETCKDAADCCRADGRCKVDGGRKKCVACAKAGETCTDAADCCTTGATCTSSTCRAP